MILFFIRFHIIESQHGSREFLFFFFQTIDFVRLALWPLCHGLLQPCQGLWPEIVTAELLPDLLPESLKMAPVLWPKYNDNGTNLYKFLPIKTEYDRRARFKDNYSAHSALLKDQVQGVLLPWSSKLLKQIPLRADTSANCVPLPLSPISGIIVSQTTHCSIHIFHYTHASQ